MKKSMKIFAMVICFAFVSPFSHAESEIESLSPKLRALLYKEMLALQEGMHAIHSFFVAGDFAEVAAVAEQIENSYIFKQVITEEQKVELKEKMPASFLELDQKSHEYAGILQHFAEENHSELVGFYYLRLTETCVSCHSQHASHRFPGFGKNAVENRRNRDNP